jgi:hypothetical protein
MVAPTKKNSPSIHTGNARNNKPAEAYDRNGTSVADGMAPMVDGIYATWKAAKDVKLTDPIPNGMSYGVSSEKTDGIETRGNGAATKGRKARGPMA